MEQKLSFSIVNSGYRATVVEEIRIDDLYVKEPEDVEKEISEKLSDAIELVYEEIYRG